MPDVNDMDLVREYADRNSESAFAGLVQRHVNLVYSVAFRFTGNSQDAQDVTQAVFIILARKAVGLRQRTIFTGWLYETTRFVAKKFLRTKARREMREQEAYMQSTLNDSNSESIWRQLAPLLEEAMTRLNEKERTLLALRFFENKSVAESAALLGIQEWAAHKRATRAVEKLRQFFTKRGIVLPVAVLTAAISANSVHAAPIGLAKTISVVAISKGATVSGSTLTIIKGALKIMAWTKMKTVVVVGVAVILAAGTTTVVVKHRQQAKEAFPGYATPEAAFQSSLWTMNKGDIKRISANFTPEYMSQFMETVGKGKSDAELSALFAHDALMLKDIQVVSNEVVTDDESILHFHSARIGNEKVPMKKIGDEWKINGDLTPDGPNNSVR